MLRSRLVSRREAPPPVTRLIGRGFDEDVGAPGSSWRCTSADCKRLPGAQDGSPGGGALRWADATLLITAASASPGGETRLDPRPRVLVLSEPGGLGEALARTLAQAGATGKTVSPGSDAQVTEV